MPAADQIFTLAAQVNSVAGDNFVETYIGTIVQTVILLVSIGIAFGTLRTTTKENRDRIEALEKAANARFDKLEGTVDDMRTVLVVQARQDERIAAMDQRILAQGQRQDAHQTTTANMITSQGMLINSRLEAINNIVAGHTAQLGRTIPRMRSDPSGGGGA